jgi:hypothetical protein
MKNIVVVMVGTDQHHDLAIEPGTTARDILRQIGAENFVLYKDAGQRSLNNTENVYPLVQDGEKLFAGPSTKVADETDPP